MSETTHHTSATDLPSGLTVMMIEPQRFLSGILRNALVSAGVFTDNIEEVQSGGKALDLLKTRIPDVILTELNLPDTDGNDLIREARDQGIGVPIVVITSEAYAHKVRDAVEAGVNDFLVKPVSQLLMSKRIARQLSSSPPVPIKHTATLSGYTLDMTTS